MGKVRRRFDAKYKEEICQQILGGVSVVELCHDHQLHRQTVERWVAKFQQGAALSGPTSLEKAQAREIEKLHAKIGQLTVQIDLLKKLDETLRQRKKGGCPKSR
jgi:transposase